MYSLTMPLKAKIIPYLDHVDESSRTFHSVNIVKTVNGETYGAGMYGFGKDHEYLGFVDKMPAHCIVLDCPVNPEYTTLLKTAEARGLTIVKGMEMMISQMTEIYDFCFGLRPGDAEKAECRKVLVAYLDSLKK